MPQTRGIAPFPLLLLAFFPAASSFGTSLGSTTAPSAGAPFWNDHAAVTALPDPPSPKQLELIRSKPYRGGFEPAADVGATYEPRVVFGAIPSDLKGSLASNGAGRIRIGSRQYGHWFDGDGYVTMLGLDGAAGTASFRGRYIRTGRYVAQEKLMKQLEKDSGGASGGTFSSPPLAFTGVWTKAGNGRFHENFLRFPSNPANTATMWLPPSIDSGLPQLFAICEGGHPIQLDPQTLNVIRGEEPLASLDGRQKVASFFSAHPKRCPVSGDIYNQGFLIRPGPLPKEMNVAHLSPSGHLLTQEKSSLPFDTLVHDSAMSANYLAYFLPPFYIGNDKLFSIMKGDSLGKYLVWHKGSKAYVQIHSRNDLKMRWRVELPETTSLYHTVDAHEEEKKDGSITLKIRIAEHEPLDRKAIERHFSDQYRVEDRRINCALIEYSFLLDRSGEAHYIEKFKVAENAAPCEFPLVNDKFRPRERRRYIWTNAASSEDADFLDGIQKVDAETGECSAVKTFGPGTYAGPPAFAPRLDAMNAEDDGYIISLVYRSNEHRSDYVIMDASTLEVVCILELRQHVPFQFHGDYLHTYCP